MEHNDFRGGKLIAVSRMLQRLFSYSTVDQIQSMDDPRVLFLRRVVDRIILITIWGCGNLAVRCYGLDPVSNNAVTNSGKFVSGAFIACDTRNPGNTQDRRLPLQKLSSESIEFNSTDLSLRRLEQSAQGGNLFEIFVHPRL